MPEDDDEAGGGARRRRQHRRYLFWCANDHVEFRVPEFEALAAAFRIEVDWVEKPVAAAASGCDVGGDGGRCVEPWVIADLPGGEDDALRLMTRSISAKYCVELWSDSGDGGSREDLDRGVRRHIEEKAPSHGDMWSEGSSFKVLVEAFMRKYSAAERLDKVESFSYLPARGPVSLDRPDHTFCYFEFFGFDHNNLPPDPVRMFFGRLVARGRRVDLVRRFSLKTRLFIGNTSMDSKLSLLMANLAMTHHGAGGSGGSLMLDPFCGTGGLMVACANFGAHAVGWDIDYLMVHAKTRPTRVNERRRALEESVRGNFRQYGLEDRFLGVVVADSSGPPLRPNLGPFLDAIVTDPPYGIREPAERVGTTKEPGTFSIPPECLAQHIPQKVVYEMGDIFGDLLALAARHLVLGGRLVFWIPVNREYYRRHVGTSSTETTTAAGDPEENGRATSCPYIPHHPCLELVANCEQVLSTHTSRRCLVMEKVKDYVGFDPEAEARNRQKVGETVDKFRETVLGLKEG